VWVRFCTFGASPPGDTCGRARIWAPTESGGWGAANESRAERGRERPLAMADCGRDPRDLAGDNIQKKTQNNTQKNKQKNE